LEICEYMKVSEATAMDMILQQGMPAGKKVGEWVSDTSNIDKWQKIKKGAKIISEKKKSSKTKTDKQNAKNIHKKKGN